MIEAVNSVLANASLLRGSAEQVDASRSFAANPEIDKVPSGPQAPYISPYITVDVNFDTAVLQIRDSDTGDVLRQFPSESTLQARQRAELEGGRIFVNDEDEGTSLQPTGEPVNSGQTVGVNAEAQVAAAALASSAQAGQVTSGNVSLTA